MFNMFDMFNLEILSFERQTVIRCLLRLSVCFLGKETLRLGDMT